MKKVSRKVKCVTWRLGYIDRKDGRTMEDVISIYDGTDMTKEVGKVSEDGIMCYSAEVYSTAEALMYMDINDFVRYAKTEEEGE